MQVFTELSLILVIAAVLAGLMKILRQPMIIAYIATGLIVGANGLNIVTSHETLGLFSEFGIALLLFIIGLGLNPKVIKDVGRIAALAGLGQVLFTSIFGFLIIQSLGFDRQESFYASMALTLSSTIIILKMISDKKETQRLYAKIATGILLVQDLVATGLLIFVSGVAKGGFNFSDLLKTGGLSLLTVTVIFSIGFYLLPKLTKFISDNQEYLFLFTIAWGIGFAALFSKIGLSIEVGALLAGVGLSALPYTQEVASRLRPLRDFFVVIFFVLLGAEMHLEDFQSVLPTAIVLSLYVLIGNPLIVITMMGISGYTKRTAFKTGLTMAQISEFSLVFIVLAQEVGVIDQKIVSIVTLVGIVTIGVSTYMMKYDDFLFNKFERYLSLFERKKIHKEATTTEQAEAIVLGFSRGSHEIIHSLEKKNIKYLVVEYDPESVDKLSQEDIPFAYGDATDPEFLDEIGIDEAKIIISTIIDPQSNLFITSHVRAVNPRAIIIVHSEKAENAIRLYERGATYVMMPHYISTEKIGKMISKNSLRKADFIPSREKHLRYVEKHL